MLIQWLNKWLVKWLIKLFSKWLEAAGLVLTSESARRSRVYVIRPDWDKFGQTIRRLIFLSFRKKKVSQYDVVGTTTKTCLAHNTYKHTHLKHKPTTIITKQP